MNPLSCANCFFSLLCSKDGAFCDCEQRLLLDTDLSVVIFLSCINSAWIDTPYYPKAGFALFWCRDLIDLRTVEGSYTNNPLYTISTVILYTL